MTAILDKLRLAFVAAVLVLAPTRRGLHGSTDKRTRPEGSDNE